MMQGVITDCLLHPFDCFWNATGTVSPDQKAAITQQCILYQVKAAGGTMSTDEANQICSGTVSSVLASDNADPAQAGVLNALGLENEIPGLGVTYGSILFIGLVGLGVILLLRR